MSTQTVEIADLGKTLEKLAQKAGAATRASLTSAAMLLRTNIVQRSILMKSDLGFPGNNTGYYARGWKTEKVVGGEFTDSYIRIYNSTPYAGIIEYGRRAGRMPPPAALVPWVRRKLRVSAKRAPGVAFAVAKKIGSRTIAGRRILTDPAYQKKLADLFRWEVERTLRKYLATGTP